VVPGTSTTTILVVSTDPSQLVNVVSLVVVIVSGMSGSSVIVDNTSELVLETKTVVEDVIAIELFQNIIELLEIELSQDEDVLIKILV